MPVVIGGLILAFLVMLLFGGTEIDRGLLILFSGGDAPRLRQAAAYAAVPAQALPLLAAGAAGAAYLLWRRQWRDAALLLGVILLGRLLVDSIQPLAQSLRPGVEERLLPSQNLAYPNSEAANATIGAFALAFLATRHQPARAFALAAAAAFALVVGASRLLLGESWPSDVIGGWAVGLAWTLLLLKLFGIDLGDGTARPLRHSSPQGEDHDREPQDRDRSRE